MKFSGAVHSIQSHQHFTSTNGDKRDQVTFASGWDKALWWQGMGVPAPMSGFSIFFSLAGLTPPVLPREHQENGCLSRAPSCGYHPHDCHFYY